MTIISIESSMSYALGHDGCISAFLVKLLTKVAFLDSAYVHWLCHHWNQHVTMSIALNITVAGSTFFYFYHWSVVVIIIATVATNVF